MGSVTMGTRMVTGKAREPENHWDRNPLGGRVYIKRCKTSVSAQVSPTLSRRPQAGYSGDRGPAGDRALPPALPPTKFHTGTARLPDPKLPEPLTSWVALGTLPALASVPHHEVVVVAAPSAQGKVRSIWETL